MTVFPLFENIDQRTFVIVGGGDVARRKVERLLSFTNRITVIAEETDLTPANGVRILRKKLAMQDLDQADFVIAATSDRALNREIAGYCSANRIPVNVVDDPALCTFIFPSIIKRGDLTIGISTGGASPAYARMLRKSIEDMLPEHIGSILETMGRLRRTVPKTVHRQADRSACYREILALLLASDGDVSAEAIEEIIRKWAEPEEEQILKKPAEPSGSNS